MTQLSKLVFKVFRELSLPFCILVATLSVGTPLDMNAQVTASGPSVFCHVTDGTFTTCPDGNAEWSDITPTLFAESGGILLVDQADLDHTSGIPGSSVDHLMLMYESGRTTPLGSDEYMLVHFMTVDEEKLLHYAVRVYGDATIQVFIDGVDQGPGRQSQIDTMKGSAGFGPSASNPTPHVLAEFQIGLELAGFEVCCYSPDPAWWSSTPPPRKKLVALFTGLGGEAAKIIGMEQLRRTLVHSGVVSEDRDARRYAYNAASAAVTFLKTNATDKDGNQVADIILIGHSWGANFGIREVADLLNNLDPPLTVQRFVQIDSVNGIGGPSSKALPSNVSERALNFFQTPTGEPGCGRFGIEFGGQQSLGRAASVDAEVHYNRLIKEITHCNIDDDSPEPRIHEDILAYALTGQLPTGDGVTLDLDPLF